MHVFTIEAMVRGYHVYQTVWGVNISEVFPCIREPGNQHNLHAVAVAVAVISCLCSIFIRQRGSVECTATDSQQYLADLAQGDMETPFRLSCKTKSILENEKSQKLLNDTLKKSRDGKGENSRGTVTEAQQLQH